MRTLVTGSAGFVGTHLVKALADRGDQVVMVDKQYGPVMDLSVYGIASLVSRRPDVIFHLASSCSTPGSIANPLQTYKDTVATAANVLDYAHRLDVPVILTSSVKARDGMTPYGAAKRMVETWALEMSATYAMTVVINRPGTIYGPGQEGSEESGWIAWFLRARAQGLTVTVNGSGEQRRDLLHVDDYVQLMLTQADAPDSYATDWQTDDHPIWDVGGGPENAVSVIDMVRYLELPYIHGPQRYGDAAEYIGKNDVPGWEPRMFWRTSGWF